MKLEIASIKVNEKSFTRNRAIIPALYRTVVRKNDIAGYFYLLEEEFAQWAREYSVDIEEVR